MYLEYKLAPVWNHRMKIGDSVRDGCERNPSSSVVVTGGCATMATHRRSANIRANGHKVAQNDS